MFKRYCAWPLYCSVQPIYHEQRLGLSFLMTSMQLDKVAINLWIKSYFFYSVIKMIKITYIKSCPATVQFYNCTKWETILNIYQINFAFFNSAKIRLLGNHAGYCHGSSVRITNERIKQVLREIKQIYHEMNLMRLNRCCMLHSQSHLVESKNQCALHVL